MKECVRFTKAKEKQMCLHILSERDCQRWLAGEVVVAWDARNDTVKECKMKMNEQIQFEDTTTHGPRNPRNSAQHKKQSQRNLDRLHIQVFEELV